MFTRAIIGFILASTIGQGAGRSRPWPTTCRPSKIYLPDRYDNAEVGGLTYGDQILIVEGGADEPFVAANVYREGIAPVFPE